MCVPCALWAGDRRKGETQYPSSPTPERHCPHPTEHCPSRMGASNPAKRGSHIIPESSLGEAEGGRNFFLVPLCTMLCVTFKRKTHETISKAKKHPAGEGQLPQHWRRKGPKPGLPRTELRPWWGQGRAGRTSESMTYWPLLPSVTLRRS